MMNRILPAILLLTLSGFGVNTLADDHKVLLCHKGKKTLSVGAAGLSAHLGHGDTQGPCNQESVPEPEEPEEPEEKTAVVMMQCKAVADNGVVVVAFSSSVEFADPPLSDLESDPDCADILAALFDAGFRLRSVTEGGESGTDYLLVGEAS